MRIHEAAAYPFFNGEKYIHDFIDYWKEHSIASNISRDALFEKFSITSTGGENFINTDWKIDIKDPASTKLPFKFGRVNGMRLQMDKLATLENTPKYVKTHFNIERPIGAIANNLLKNLEGCPEQAGSIAFEVSIPVENLRTGLKSPIERIWIDAPSIKSFEGMNVYCEQLELNLTNQKSISGIHKQLKNVKRLFLLLPSSFSGGLLSLAMIPKLETLMTNLEGRNFGYGKAITIIQIGRSQKKNVHEIQEDLIDAGLNAFATL